jgi:tetratricopeptide (TPR) repeat protein
MALGFRAFLCGAVLAGAVARSGECVADTIWVRATGSAPLSVPNVVVTRAAGGKIYFRVGQVENVREASQIYRLAIDDEPALTRAEMAYVDGQFDAATDGYVKFLGATARDDLRAYAGLRLIDAAGKAGRLDAAVGGYVCLVEADASTSGEHRPVVAGAKPGVLDAAIAELDKALAPTRPAAQKVALLRLKIDVLRARGDTARIAGVLEQLVSIADDPSAEQLLGDARLSEAVDALAAGDPARAVATIEKYRGLFGTPAQQAGALFALAKGKEQLAVKSGGADALKDAALAHLRAAADFPGDGQAGPSLLAAGRLLAASGDAAEARKLYESMIDSPLAADARRALAELK